MTWAQRSRKDTAAVVLRLSGGLGIERHGGFSQKGGGKGKGMVMHLNWEKVLYNYTVISQ